ncbi:MAG: proliferating cell nuclear antigen (pcna) [Candidatus Aenigmatarchaeota archaeon]
MFSAKLTDIKAFRDSIETIAQLIDEGVLKIRSSGIELTATDRAMVTLVDFKIFSNAFAEYNYSGDLDIGLNIINFLTILKRIDPSDILTLKFNEEEQRLELYSEGKSTRTFAIPILDISSEETSQITGLEFPSTADIKSEILEQGISDGDIIADSMLFELQKDKFILKAEGDGSKVEIKVNAGENLTINNIRETVKSRYPLDYLKKIIKASKLSEIAKISFGTDYPIKLEFSNPNIHLSFILAPRVSEE